MARKVLSLSFGLVVAAFLALVPAGCDQLDDFLDGIHGHGGHGDGGTVGCGNATCAGGQVCCNASCGICTPPGGVCTQQICDPPSACRADADCRLFSDYCTGCDCRALAPGVPDPTCPGPGVQCLVDPCQGKSAVCKQGACSVAGR